MEGEIRREQPLLPNRNLQPVVIPRARSTGATAVIDHQTRSVYIRINASDLALLYHICSELEQAKIKILQLERYMYD